MSGLLGAMEGLGKGISRWGEVIVKTELEKAKELRDRNFKREMYQEERANQLSDLKTKRGWQEEDLARGESFQLSRDVMQHNLGQEAADAAQRRSLALLKNTREHKRTIGSRVEEVSMDGKPTKLLLNAYGEVIQDWDANSKNLVASGEVQELNPKDQYDLWKHAKTLQKDISSQMASLRKEIGTGTEDRDVELRTQLSDLETQSEELERDMNVLAPMVGRMLSRAEQIRQFGPKASVAFPELSQEKGIEKYLEATQVKLTESNFEPIVEGIIAEDPSSLKMLEVWRAEPSRSSDYIRVMEEVSSRTHGSQEALKPASPEPQEEADEAVQGLNAPTNSQQLGIKEDIQPSPAPQPAVGIQRKRSPLVDLASSGADQTARGVQKYMNDPEHLVREVERLQALVDNAKTGPERNLFIRRLGVAKRKLEQAQNK